MKTPNNEEKSSTTENNAVKGEAKKPSRLKKWGKELVSMILIVGVVSFAMDFYHSRSMPQGDTIPIVGQSLQGEDIDVIELSKNGKPVIVYFWATWCGACKFVSPTVNSFSDSHQVVSVALSSGPDERVQRYLDAKEYDFLLSMIFLDQSAEVGALMSLQASSSSKTERLAVSQQALLLL